MSQKFPRIYKSKYTTNLVTAPQYLAEIVCENMAAKEGKVLTQNFWNDKYWSYPYKGQVAAANGLLKLYSAEALINVLTRPDKRSKVLSLRQEYPLLIDVKKEQDRLNALAEKAESLEVVKPDDKPSEYKPYVRRNKGFDKLN